MEIFKRIFFAAILVGIVAGLVQSVVMQWRVVPLILEAETYEMSEGHVMEQEVDKMSVAPNKHEMSEQPWEPQDGFERIFYTVLSTLLVGLGFAFLMVAISTLVSIEINLSNGLIWGLAGFFSFSLMPAIGLPPELPGMIAAELGARQIWWWGTVLATAGAILLVVKIPKPISFIIALILFLAPHIIGAPIPLSQQSDVPAYLATSFAANALFSSLIFWLTLGSLFGFYNNRMKDN